jgi:hypothetical protein
MEYADTLKSIAAIAHIARKNNFPGMHTVHGKALSLRHNQ